MERQPGKGVIRTVEFPSVKLAARLARKRGSTDAERARVRTRLRGGCDALRGTDAFPKGPRRGLTLVDVQHMDDRFPKRKGSGMDRASNTAYYTLFEREQDTLDDMLREYRSGQHPRMPWKVVPAARLMRIWKDAARDGFVRDVKGLDRISETFIDNVCRIAVNTEISGHSQVTQDEALSEHLEPEEQEAFVEWAIETAEGGWRITDYGLERLRDLAAQLIEAETPERKLVALDMMLNVAHQRSDLASWFVEGGSRTLSELSGEERPSEEAARAPAL